MNLVYEDKFGLSNFINCNDLNSSGIRRFGISPLITATQIHFTMLNKESSEEFKMYELGVDDSDVDNYVIAAAVNHSPDDWTGFDPKVKSFFYHLNEKYIEDLRNDRAFLMLDQSLEGYQTPWLWNYFHEQCREWGVSPKRIIYVTGNMIVEDVYNQWLKDNNITECLKVIGYPHFELDMAKCAYDRSKSENPLPSFDDHLKYKNDNINNIKTFACLNKRIRPHRVWFYAYLYYSKLLNIGLVSMNQFDQHTYPWEGKELTKEQILEISSILPILVHEKRNDEFDDNFYIRRFNDKISLDTYFSVISEAHCGDSNQTMFLSEKTFKVIAVNHPFMIMGNKDSMKMMREIGYKTFDGPIDEMYDSLPTHERLESLINSIQKIDDTQNKIEWFKSTRDIVEYNYDKLISKLYELPYAYVKMRDYINSFI
jgi:hypothetical protein